MEEITIAFVVMQLEEASASSRLTLNIRLAIGSSLSMTEALTSASSSSTVRFLLIFGHPIG